MDITEIAASETFELHLEHPKLGLLYNDDEPVTITIYGPDSACARKQNYESLNDQLSKNKKPATAEELFDEGNKLLAGRVVSVHGLSSGGKAIDANNIIDVLSDPAQGWLRDQLDKATVNRALFFGSA